MKKLLIGLVFLSAVIFAQEKIKLTGSLSTDLNISFNKTDSQNSYQFPQSENRKSPFLAGLLSFALPGAGEFYTENYILSAVFLAIEAAAISAAVIYDGKGDDQTEFFESYANQHWSANRYALWTITNATSINSGVDPSQFNVFDNSGNVNWNELNRLERALGGYYSHQLERFGEQQYYEMIGKYPQFNVGWDDFGDENTPFQYGDPVTEKFKYYSDQRGKANDYYSVAKTAVIVVVTNHIISAVDAAWAASRYNKNLSMDMSLEKAQTGFASHYYPQLNLHYSF